MISRPETAYRGRTTGCSRVDRDQILRASTVIFSPPARLRRGCRLRLAAITFRRYRIPLRPLRRTTFRRWKCNGQVAEQRSREPAAALPLMCFQPLDAANKPWVAGRHTGAAGDEYDEAGAITVAGKRLRALIAASPCPSARTPTRHPRAARQAAYRRIPSAAIVPSARANRSLPRPIRPMMQRRGRVGGEIPRSFFRPSCAAGVLA